MLNLKNLQNGYIFINCHQVHRYKVTMCMRRGELPATRFLKRQPAALTLLRKGDSDCRSEMKDDGNWGCPGICWCGTLDAVLECYLVGGGNVQRLCRRRSIGVSQHWVKRPGEIVSLGTAEVVLGDRDHAGEEE